ncbi:hypothetical protein NBZ79_09420 [Sneathiella marina]|uniref:Glycerophosphoryl diester phosphodiesterase membrane domain-containing protein n=1 Tax=Sneathiella marina TaxID=2950108 RepID=A0ABY4W8T5_9PROT|nr:hypothetical protein [Sneathiella marina]USG63194.1 hypothetical protein NBZ79_09420 [Sneathiella marina]
MARLYPIVLIVIGMALLETLFPEEQVVIGLAIIILLYVLQYNAFSKCLPKDILIPVPTINKIAGFVYRNLLLLILSSIFVVLFLLFIVAGMLIFPDASNLLESFRGTAITAVLSLIILTFPYCYVVAKIGLILPAGMAGHDTTFSTAMDRSMGKVRATFFKMLFGPAMLFFVMPSVLMFIGVMISSLAGLDTPEGEMPVWLSSSVSVLTISFICWGEVMMASNLSALFIKVRTVSVDAAPVTSMPTTS